MPAVRGAPVAAWLLRQPRTRKRGIQALADFLLLLLALYLAYVLRMETLLPRDPADIAIAAVIAAAVGVGVFERLGLYAAVVRYMGLPQFSAVAGGLAAAVVALALGGWVLELFVPRSVPPLFALNGLLLLGGLRLIVRQALRQVDQAGRTRVAIYGAGSAGRQLAAALFSGNENLPVLFVDDSPAQHHSTVMGLPVLPAEALPVLVGEYDIARVLLAIPGASLERRRAVLDQLMRLPIPTLTVPAVGDIVNGKLSVSALREVVVSDLLGREAVAPIPSLMDADLRGKAVMVTGAGGSIGSELCRLALEQQPACLVLYELSEFALYRIEAELRSAIRTLGAETRLVPVLGSVRDAERLLQTMRLHRVETVYHAAAYKHVPMVESNPGEGLLNNAFGTVAVVQAAVGAGVRCFVLISTDKAVRPTNVMGASKRVAELVCQAWAGELANHPAAPRISMVRFGNVLDSSGSVVPLFRGQIAAGGPVTVTHPEIIRYFMTIREAAELVIQAGAMARGGEVFVLDMGEPVRIADLASKMIRLSGFSVRDDANPDGDIQVVYSGLRPGEKLYEELLISEQDAPTRHVRIRSCQEPVLPMNALTEHLDALRSACLSGDIALIRAQLTRLPLQYRPESSGFGGIIERHPPAQ